MMATAKPLVIFFKKVKAGERPLARWAVTTLLSIAPDEAMQSCLIRNSIKKIQFSAPKTFNWLGKGGTAGKPSSGVTINDLPLPPP